MRDLFRWLLHWTSSVPAISATPIAATIYGPNPVGIVYGANPGIAGYSLTGLLLVLQAVATESIPGATIYGPTDSATLGGA